MIPQGTAIIQARMGSSRLPGKAMMNMGGKPLLWYVIATLKQSPAVRQIVVAVPDTPADHVLLELARQMGVQAFGGSEENVLERFYLAARAFPDDYYFRATGDNPILDSANPERSLRYLITHRLDYACEDKLPVGCVVEAFTANALEKSFCEGTSPEDIEHVTWYIKKSGKFCGVSFAGKWLIFKLAG